MQGDTEFLHDIHVDEKFGLRLKLFRLDQLHPTIQGNKYFKLQYNIEYALENNLALVTMGGAHSNHIHAAALACQSEAIPCYGIIRGKNFHYLSPTLQKAQELGMHLIFVDRDQFRIIRETNYPESIVEIEALESAYHFVPEGGSNEWGVKGAEEILSGLQLDYDVVFCPVGTGGTLAGIIRYLKGDKTVIGISCLKDEYLTQAISEMTMDVFDNWQVNFNYHFGGYAKWNADLIEFINQFKSANKVPLCPIYTGKMMYGIYDLIHANFFPAGTKILALHTGGLQGIEGFNKVNKHILN